jgi:ribonuclease P protein component
MSSSLPKRRNTFHANERVKGKKLAKELFEEGSSFFLYPFVVKYVSRTDLNNTQVLITAPKKKLRRAVDRNLVKRRVREAYRLNKFILLDNISTNQVVFSLIYIAGKPLDFQFIEEKLKEVLSKLQDEIQN